MQSDFESQTHLLFHAYYNHITYFHHDVFGLSYLDESWFIVIVIHQNRSFWDTFTPNLAITPSDVTVRSCHFTQIFPDLLSQNYIPIIVSHHSTIFIHIPCLSDKMAVPVQVWVWYPRKSHDIQEMSQTLNSLLQKKKSSQATPNPAPSSPLLLCSASGIYLARRPIVGPNNTCAHLRWSLNTCGDPGEISQGLLSSLDKNSKQNTCSISIMLQWSNVQCLVHNNLNIYICIYREINNLGEPKPLLCCSWNST